VHKSLELSYQLGMSPQRKLGLDAMLERCDSELLEPGDSRLSEGLVGEICQGWSPPELEGPTEAARRSRGITLSECAMRLVAPALEEMEVDLLGCYTNQIARLARLEQRARNAGRTIRIEKLAEVRDVRLQLGHDRGWRRITIEIVREPVDRNDPIRAQ